jgi:selenocysteine lyase/cysteine desulfurase
MSLDLDRIRVDTPGVMGTLFFDSAGSSLPPLPVLDTVISHLRLEAQVGGYRAAEMAGDRLTGVKQSIAGLIGCAPDDIALLDSAGRAWNEFFSAVPFQPGDRILTCRADYPSNAVNALKARNMFGVSVEVIPSDEFGRVDLGALAAMLDDRVRLVSLVEVPTNSGLINPVREVVELAHQHGALVVHDACQSTGQLPVNVAESGVDALSSTGRKWLRGPRGTGFLYVNPKTTAGLEPRVLGTSTTAWTSAEGYEVANDASRFEQWEGNIAGFLGLGAAVDYLLRIGVDEASAALRANARRLRTGLAGIPGAQVWDLGDQLSGIVTFTLAGKDVDSVVAELAGHSVSCHFSRRTSAQYDMAAKGLSAVVRLSPHYFNTDSEIDHVLELVSDIASGLKS